MICLPEIPKHVTLVVVSKGRSVDEILQVYEKGVRDFGENRIPEAFSKMEALPRDIRWHFVGKLQRKKVPKILGRFHLIHSVDTPELAFALDRGNESILLQVNTSGEATKSGLSPEEWKEHIPNLLQCKNLKVKGLMTMAPQTEDQGVLHKTFASLRLMNEGYDFPILSMGMSYDYKIAIEEGSTLVRLGRVIF